MFRPGPKNLITDVAGLGVGHADAAAAKTGVTVLRCAAAWNAAVDVRGGAPGLRETEVLAPENLVGRVHALVLAGGSVFGLAAADGVAAALSAEGIGLNLRPGTHAIPIVPAAVLHDLSNGGDKAWGAAPPYRELGVSALRAAGADFAQGCAGAGYGAMAGLSKGGIGSASLDLGDGLVVGALVAVNASDPAPAQSRLQQLGRLQAGANTTLAVVACTADLATVECKRVAMMAHDGIARAVRPAHTPFDGDTVFALASAAVGGSGRQQRPALIARLGSAGADCVARAIARAVHHAR